MILEEIRMRDDTPDDLVHDVFAVGDVPGSPDRSRDRRDPETITAMERDAIADFHAARYHPSNVVVAVAGNLEHDAVVAMVEAGPVPPRSASGRHAPCGKAGPTRCRWSWSRTTSSRRTWCSASARCRVDDYDRYAFGVLNQVLGGGMSSRLFQEVRERRGLAYSVYSYRAAYEETGALGIYAGTAPERVDELLGVLDDQLHRLVVDGGVSDRELDAAKGHLTGRWPCRRELEQPHAPPRPQRAPPRRDPLARPARRRVRRRHRRRREPVVDRCCVTPTARSWPSAPSPKPTWRANYRLGDRAPQDVHDRPNDVSQG